VGDIGARKPMPAHPSGSRTRTQVKGF